MILEKIIELNYLLFFTFFGWLPDLPPMPEQIINSFNLVMPYFLNAIGIIKFFLGSSFVNILFFVFLTLIQFKYLYKIIVFIGKRLMRK